MLSLRTLFTGASPTPTFIQVAHHVQIGSAVAAIAVAFVFVVDPNLRWAYMGTHLHAWLFASLAIILVVFKERQNAHEGTELKRDDVRGYQIIKMFMSLFFYTLSTPITFQAHSGFDVPYMPPGAFVFAFIAHAIFLLTLLVPAILTCYMSEIRPGKARSGDYEAIALESNCEDDMFDDEAIALEAEVIGK